MNGNMKSTFHIDISPTLVLLLSLPEEAYQTTRRSLPSFVGTVQMCGWVCTGGRQQDLRGHVKLDRSRYISIPEGEGQFVPVIWRVHGDSLTVIQSLATLSLSLLSLSPLFHCTLSLLYLALSLRTLTPSIPF